MVAHRVWGACMLAAATSIITPLNGQDSARQISETFWKGRPDVATHASAPGPAGTAVSTAKSGEPAKPSTAARPLAPAYRASGPEPPKPATASHIVGFTVWRLRPATRDLVGPRLLVQDAEYGPERLPPGAPLRVGDRVRIGIEVGREGYLYVINRERLADGSTGAVHLIFPAGNLRGGNNRVVRGQLIEIPGQGDRVPAMRVDRLDARHVGEDLLVLVTEQPIAELTIAERETPLTPEQVRQWERQWGSDTTRLDLVSDEHTRGWTTAEQEAGLQKRLLTQDDPMPAALYLADLRGEGVMVNIPLRVE